MIGDTFTPWVWALWSNSLNCFSSCPLKAPSDAMVWKIGTIVRNLWPHLLDRRIWGFDFSKNTHLWKTHQAQKLYKTELAQNLKNDICVQDVLRLKDMRTAPKNANKYTYILALEYRTRDLIILYSSNQTLESCYGTTNCCESPGPMCSSTSDFPLTLALLAAFLLRFSRSSFLRSKGSVHQPADTLHCEELIGEGRMVLPCLWLNHRLPYDQ